MLSNVRNLCQTFFKDPFKQYISSVEPVLVSQSCALVNSFMYVLQSQSGGSSKEHEDADIHFAYTEGFANMSIDTDGIVGGCSTWFQEQNQICTICEPRKSNLTYSYK